MFEEKISDLVDFESFCKRFDDLSYFDDVQDSIEYAKEQMADHYSSLEEFDF